VNDVAGILLAGGRAERMGGGDKCLLRLGGHTLLDRAVARAAPQVAALALSANGDPARFSRSGLPVLADPVPDRPGPLAGILAGLRWAKYLNGCRWLASFATDGPFFPLDLVARLLDAASDAGAEVALPASAGRTHPVFGLWQIGLAAPLTAILDGDGPRAVERFARSRPCVVVSFDDRPVDPFFNVNRPDDLAEAERLLAAQGPS